MSFLVRFNQNDSPVTPGGGPFSNDDVIVLALRSAFTPAVHDSNTVRFDIYPMWNGFGADDPTNNPNVSAGAPDDTLTVDGQTFTNTWNIRNNHRLAMSTSIRGSPAVDGRHPRTRCRTGSR